MAKHKIGIIGAGARAESFSKELYAGLPRAELAGICDIDPDRLGKFIEYCGLQGARTFTDPAEFLALKEMDAVLVTTPDFTHRDVALQVLKARKHMYIEKPLASTAAQCREIIRAQKRSGMVAFIGFNLRAIPLYRRLKEIVDSGALGQIVHIDAFEQLSQAHGASFMRRFHRKKQNTGGFLNHKCSHDLDIMQWLIGHEHKIVKVASFGGLNVFLPKKAPAKFCHDCPQDIWGRCRYRDRAGFVFPVSGKKPIHKTTQLDVYGGDLCVYTDDKDTVDNQTVIMEWDNGVRGNFNLQLFQAEGDRETRIWGEKASVHSSLSQFKITVVISDTGEVIEHRLVKPRGGHSGADPLMLNRFMDAIESGDPGDSSLAEGLAATLIAEKGRLAMEGGSVMPVSRKEYAR